MTIEENWERLLKYWDSRNIFNDFKCQGASAVEIERVKNYYKDIPESLLKSLAFCNNFKRALGVENDNWGELYDIDNMLEASELYPTFGENDAGWYSDVLGDIKIPDTAMPKEWIPIYDWNTDYVVAIDMLSENKGQIIMFGLEWSMIRLWANSYEEWFEMVVNEVLEYGELRPETLEDVITGRLHP